MNNSSAKLRFKISDTENEQTLSLVGTEFVFGRSQDSQIVLNDQAYSRSHFRLSIKDGRLCLSDLKSSNGTFLNNKIIKSANTPVAVGDEISTSNSEIFVTILAISIEIPNKKKAETTQNSINIGRLDLSKSLQRSRENKHEEDGVDEDVEVDYDEPYSDSSIDEREEDDEEVFDEIPYKKRSKSQDLDDDLYGDQQEDSDDDQSSDQTEDDDDNDFNTAILTDRIFSAANQQVSEILNSANQKAKEIIAVAEDEYEVKIRENIELVKADFESRKKVIEVEIEQYRQALENATLNSIEEDKQRRLERLAAEMQAKHTNLQELYEIESQKIAEEKSLKISSAQKEFEERVLKQNEEFEAKGKELKAQIKKIEDQLLLKNDEYQKLDSKLEEKIKAIEKEIDQQLKTKKKDLEVLLNNFEKEKDKQQKDIDNQIIEKKNDLTRVTKEMSDVISTKQNEINKMVAMYEEQKKLQIQMLESDVEKKKVFYEEQLSQLEAKVSATQLDLSTLIANYDTKKKEEMQIISDLKNKNEQLKNSVLRYQDDLKKKNEENQELIDTINSEIEALKKKRVEFTHEIDGLKKETDNLMAQNNDLIQQNNSVEAKIKQGKAYTGGLEAEAKAYIAQKEALIPEIENLKNQVNESRKKLDDLSREAVHVQKNHEKEIAGLDVVFSKKKEALDQEIKKLKEAEEKKIQNMVLQEINQINKLKEESLKMVLELEDSITKELVNATMKVFANTVGASKFKEIAPDYEKSIRTSLQNGVLKLLKNELNPTKSPNAKKLSSNPKIMKPVIISSLVSSFLFGVLPYIYRQVEDQSDPVRIEMEARKKAAAVVPKKKFTPTKVLALKETFVDSVIYTEGFAEVYAKEEFRSELMKKGSTYLYKQWQIEEEKSIEAYAMIFSMIDVLKSKAEKIDPDNEQKDIQKMTLIEKETLKKLEKIFGNEVRLEAAMKFQTRFYKEFKGETPAE